MKNQVMIYGKHSVISAINNKKRKIEKIYISSNDGNLLELFKKKKYKVIRVEKKTIDSLLQKNTKHQGILVIAQKKF